MADDPEARVPPDVEDDAAGPAPARDSAPEVPPDSPEGADPAPGGAAATPPRRGLGGGFGRFGRPEGA